jgi:FAD/FMN-containing dehydrogenase
MTQRVRPNQAGWPDAAAWNGLRDAVGGNLEAVKPLFHGDDAEVTANLANPNPFFIGDQAAGTQSSGWLGAWTSAPSAYAVRARGAKDVAAAVDFARDRKLRLVVKGGGHSYLGTSNAPDSLLVWTRSMNQVTLHDAFVPQGGEGEVEPLTAVSAGSGAMWIDLYDAVTTKAGRYVQGGGCTSVGVAGLVQSGGFSSFSKGFGTAAGSLLEAEIVTADGRIRIVNAHRDPDLFWALKGGGGGSWGVVTRVTLRTYDLPEKMAAALGKIHAKSDDAFRRLLSRFLAHYREKLFNPHWGEHVSMSPANNLRLSMAFHGSTFEQARSDWQDFFDWVAARPQDYEIVEPLEMFLIDGRDAWNADRNSGLKRDPRPGAPAHHAWGVGDGEQVGAYWHGYESLWLPAALLGQDNLLDALFAASRHKAFALHFNKGLAGAPKEAIERALDTATNPAVTEAFALAIISDGEGPAFPGQQRPAIDLNAARKNSTEIDNATAELRRIAPNAGSYVSESNYFNRSWQSAYWGANYPKLQAVKAKYDPEGLFFVHHGVGSEDWSPDGFTRLR